MTSTEIVVGLMGVIVTLLLAILTAVWKASGAWARLQTVVEGVQNRLLDVIESNSRVHEKMEDRLMYLERNREGKRNAI